MPSTRSWRPLALADRLSLAPAAGSADTLHVAGDDVDRAALGRPAANLVLRAIAATRAAVGGARPTPTLAARLEKRIPIAAGLAGGSSDAAAAIDGALEAWGAGGDSVLSADERACAWRLGWARTCRSSWPASSRSARAVGSG